MSSNKITMISFAVLLLILIQTNLISSYPMYPGMGGMGGMGIGLGMGGEFNSNI
jgi:hypothetical protein